VTPHTEKTSIDLSQVLDHGPWTGFQISTMLWAALAVIFDGFDNQLIGFAIPSIMKDWGLPRSDFAPVVAIGLIGMTTGSAIGGFLGDRFGRRIALLGSVILFGLATGGASLTNGVTMLAAMRFLAGAGIGGALPIASTLIAEFTPLRRRPLAVTLTIVCVPLGGMVAGLVAGRVLPTLGWRTLFAGLLAFILPESPRFLARRPALWPKLVALLQKMNVPAAADSTFADVAEQKVETRTPVSALFGKGRLGDTLSLWLAFFSCLISVYMVFSWLPTLLTSKGLGLADSSLGLTVYNFGGVLGPLLFGSLMSRFGSRWILIGGALGGSLSAFALRDIGAPGTADMALLTALGIHGFFVNAVQTTMFALAAHVYPTSVRATGSASALAIGRIGSILSASAGSRLVQGGQPAYFGFIALAMAGTLTGLALVRNHIPARKS
jgi:AAHS family 4-hydroxybenzoate transporter-like MFS transporter